MGKEKKTNKGRMEGILEGAVGVHAVMKIAVRGRG